MTKKEFIKTAIRRGYCDFAQARDFCKRHPQPEYDESELDQVYRIASELLIDYAEELRNKKVSG